MLSRNENLFRDTLFRWRSWLHLHWSRCQCNTCITNHSSVTLFPLFLLSSINRRHPQAGKSRRTSSSCSDSSSTAVLCQSLFKMVRRNLSACHQKKDVLAVNEPTLNWPYFVHFFCFANFLLFVDDWLSGLPERRSYRKHFPLLHWTPEQKKITRFRTH